LIQVPRGAFFRILTFSYSVAVNEDVGERSLRFAETAIRSEFALSVIPHDERE